MHTIPAKRSSLQALSVFAIVAIGVFIALLTAENGTLRGMVTRYRFRREVDHTMAKYAEPYARHLLHLAKPYLSQGEAQVFAEELSQIPDDTDKNDARQYRDMGLKINEAIRATLPADILRDDRQWMISELEDAYRCMDYMRENDENGVSRMHVGQWHRQFTECRRKFEELYINSQRRYPLPK